MDEKFAPLNPSVFRDTIPLFRGENRGVSQRRTVQKDYKGFSGKYGSYAQRDGRHHMLRLRTTAGRLTKDKLNFLIRTLDEQNVPMVHFTTCQAVQLHDLDPEQVYAIMDNALDSDIVCYGGGGDYPETSCVPLWLVWIRKKCSMSCPGPKQPLSSSCTSSMPPKCPGSSKWLSPAATPMSPTPHSGTWGSWPGKMVPLMSMPQAVWAMSRVLA